MRIRYNLKKPGNGRASFAVIKDTLYPDGRRHQTTVRDERIESLNKLYREGMKGATVCEIEIKAMIEEWHKADERRLGTIVYNEDNRRILEEYWQRKYAHKQLSAPQAAKNRLMRAIEALGPLSIVSTDINAMQKAINRKLKGNAQRERVAAINQLLKSIGRNVQLAPAPKERRKVRHLTPEEFALVNKTITNEPLRLFYVAAFATGGRTGEVMAITPERIHGDVVYIETQLDRNEIERHTKNRRERHAVIHPDWLADVKKWARVPEETRCELLKERLAGIFADHCAKALPDEPRKRCSVKDLRHSYAIWLLSKGVSMGLVAQSLGNSESVCQEYYAGFELAPDSIMAIRAIINRG